MSNQANQTQPAMDPALADLPPIPAHITQVPEDILEDFDRTLEWLEQYEGLATDGTTQPPDYDPSVLMTDMGITDLMTAAPLSYDDMAALLPDEFFEVFDKKIEWLSQGGLHFGESSTDTNEPVMEEELTPPTGPTVTMTGAPAGSSTSSSATPLADARNNPTDTPADTTKPAVRRSARVAQRLQASASSGAAMDPPNSDAVAHTGARPIPTSRKSSTKGKQPVREVPMLTRHADTNSIPLGADNHDSICLSTQARDGLSSNSEPLVPIPMPSTDAGQTSARMTLRQALAKIKALEALRREDMQRLNATQATVDLAESTKQRQEAEHNATKHQLNQTEAQLAQLHRQLRHAWGEVGTLRDAQMHLGRKLAQNKTVITEVMMTKVHHELPMLQQAVRDVSTYRVRASGLRYALQRAVELETQKIHVLQHYLANAYGQGR
ncbi:hypothetical protein BJX68DRAFT_262077 [Aspergillus pseudodeflectus]|uniref:Uncharacterized protein n=1 Tax=Aspergillus pseudodeflectus TaxID=176178 RepID=A0ABR4L523_9EURO